MDRIELMNRNYVILKTKLSLVTAVTVGCILGLLKIKLWLIWGASDIHDTPLRICCLPLPAWVAADHRKLIALGGLSFGTGVLTFVLNFIPNVGSLIAMFLPLPVVLLDPQLKSWQKIGAFAGPGAVQGYVGNVLEPTVFGASLNMTPLSILSALVMWSSVWGLPGAILSVPMLGIQKISMGYINHPFAKYMLMIIREDPTLDEAKARDESGDFGLPIPLPGEDAGGDAPAAAAPAPEPEEKNPAADAGEDE